MLDKIDNYVVVSRISEGTSGVVYLVEREGARYALKLLKAVDSAALVRFRRESATLARMKHENLVRIFNVGEFGGTPYLVMEYLEGDSLENKIRKEGRIPVQTSLEIIKALAKALLELHKNNLIHRDIKPANILLTKDGVPKLIDFGLVGDVEFIKEETALVGTPMYCSPEQSRVLKREVDFRSDLYSLGVVLFELMTGRPPLMGTLSEILQKHASTVPLDVREIDPKISAAAALITKKLLSKDPDDRFQTCSGLVHDLDRVPEIERLLEQNADPALGSHDNVVVSNKVAFVKRAAETASLTSVWQEVLTGKPGMVVVTGPSGSGKTRLSDEFVRTSLGTGEDREYLVLKGKCQLFDKDLPFAAIREAIESWLEDLTYCTPEVRERFEQRIRQAARGAEERLPRFSKSLQKYLGSGAAPVQAKLNAEADREIFYNDISDFFLRLGKAWKGVILFVDDLQWLDDSSLQLMETIFRTRERNVFFLLGTARDDQESQARMASVKERLASHIREEIKVEPFTKAQLGELFRDFLGVPRIDAEIVEQIYLRSVGSPFVSIEILRSSIDQGLIRFKEGEWVMGEGGFDRLALSENVYGLIIKRADKLPENAKRFLQYAALFGNNFVARDIARLSGVEESGLAATLRSCEEIGLVERQGPQKWRFVHDKIQESLISSISPEAVAEMSDSLAELYDNRESKTAEEVFVIARLYARGNVARNFVKVIESGLRAGELALENFAFSESFNLFRHAHELMKGHGLQSVYERALVPKLATCATIMGNWPLARECADRHIALARDDVERQASLMLKVWTLKNKGDYTAAWAYFEKACLALGEEYPLNFHWKVLLTGVLWFWTSCLDFFHSFFGISLEEKAADAQRIEKVADLYVDAQWCAEYLTKRVDYVYLTFRILLLGLRGRRRRELALGYAWLGHVYGSFGLLALAKVYFRKVESITEGMSDKFTVASCRQRQVDSLDQSGGLRNYEQGHREILGEYEKYLLPVQIGYSTTLRGINLGFRGLHKEAMALYENGLRGVETGKTVLSDVYSVIFMTQYWLALASLGQFQKAQQIRQTGMRINSANRYNAYVSRVTLNVELQVHRVLEEVDKDLEEYLSALLGNNIHIFNQPSSNLHAQVLFNVLYLLERTDSPEKRLSLRREFNQVIRVINRTMYCPTYRMSYYLLRARYYRITGARFLAERYLKKAEDFSSRHDGMRVLFEVQRDRARIQRARGNENLMETNLNSAAALAQEYGWTPTIERLRAEFGVHAEKALARAAAVPGASQTQMQAQATSQAAATQQARSASQQARSASQQGAAATSLRGAGVEEVRFSDALLKVSHAFVNSINPVEQSKSVLTQIVKLFAAERGLVFLKEPGEKELRILGGKNSAGEDIDRLAGFSSTVVGRVFDSAEPLIVTGTDQGEALGSESAVLHNLRSIMATPLTIKDQVLGVVYLDSSLTKGLFTKPDLDLFATLANHISVAFELSRMAKVELEKAELKRALDVQSAIAAESRKVAVLVDNMQQAVFSVDRQGSIVEPVSKFSTRVFGLEVSGKNILETLYAAPSVATEQRDSVATALNTVFGEDDLQWDLMESNIIRKVAYQAPEPGHMAGDGAREARTLRVLPSPIWDDRQRLERILFVVEDVTTLESLERQVSEHRLEAALLEELLGSRSRDLESFLATAKATLRRLLESSGVAPDSAHGAQVLRELHTLKGNSRLHGLKYLSDQVHQSESALVEAAAASEPSEGQTGFRDSLERQLSQIEAVLTRYETMNAKMSGGGRSIQTTPAPHAQAVSTLRRLAMELESVLPAARARDLKTAVNGLFLQSIREMVLGFEPMLHDISRQLSKRARLVVEGDFLASADRLQLLQESLLHLIRNSIDHGLEAPADRLKVGKNEEGTLLIRCEELEGRLQVTVADDGGGIDGEKVWQKARERKIRKVEGNPPFTMPEKINLIFEPGLSTKDTASDVSGRGIGLDVVKRNIESMQGSLRVESEPGKGSRFILLLPKEDGAEQDQVAA